MKRVYCLYRVSTLGQVEKDDIPMQKQACHEFAERQGWEIINEYSEKGVSGFKVSAKDRDAIQQIQAAALEKKFDILLVFMFDRLGRRDDETPFVVEWFVQNGIEVWSTNEGQQRFDNHVDKLMNYIRYWQASGESIKTSVRTKTRMGQIVQEGRYRGGTVPYGYRLVKKGRLNKKGLEICDIEIEPCEVETVKLIFHKYVYEGLGVNRLIFFLTEQGIKNHQGKRFSFTSMRGIIQNPIYIGKLKSGESVSESFSHLRIIDDDTFETAQTLKGQRSKEFTKPRNLPMNTKGQCLLSGNIFCAHCGGRLHISTNSKVYKKADGSEKITKRFRYVCYNKTRKICECNGQSGYTATKLDNIVSELLLKLFRNVKSISGDELIEKQHQNELASCTAKLKAAKAELKKHSDSLQTLQGEVVNAINGTSKFESGLLNELIIQTREKVDSAAKQVQACELELETRQRQVNDIKSNYKNLMNWAEIFQDSSTETKKMISAYLIESIKVGRNYDVEVKFNVAYENFCVAS